MLTVYHSIYFFKRNKALAEKIELSAKNEKTDKSPALVFLPAFVSHISGKMADFIW